MLVLFALKLSSELQRASVPRTTGFCAPHPGVWKEGWSAARGGLAAQGHGPSCSLPDLGLHRGRPTYQSLE